MAPLQDQFWQRFLELAQERLIDQKNQQFAYDYFVSDAQLISVQDHKALIYLDMEQKQNYWEKNLADLILTAGFEIYGNQIILQYIFDLDTPTPPQMEVAEERRALSPSLSLEEIRQRSGLKGKYTFDTFVQGEGNMWAKSAALAVSDSENLGGIYNPLFIYGGPGLGKTHLLNAIGNEVLSSLPSANIKYVTAETFINDFLEHLRLNDMDNFKKTYRSLDLLLIDDIQSLSKKVSTQEEFFNTFNALHGNNKQIVLTSDRSPDHLENLEERLVTRFKWGLTNDITPPDFETRVAILKNKIEEYPLIFPNDTIEYLAGQFDSNVRDLEGALKDINLLANVSGIQEITIEVAARAIRSRKQDATQVKVIPIERIQTEVGNFYGVSVKEMKGTRRVQNIVLARQVAMYLSRELTDNSLPKIGREFGGKDHTTVIHAHGKIKTMLADDDNLAREIEAIKNKIK